MCKAISSLGQSDNASAAWIDVIGLLLCLRSNQIGFHSCRFVDKDSDWPTYMHIGAGAAQNFSLQIAWPANVDAMFAACG